MAAITDHLSSIQPASKSPKSPWNARNLPPHGITVALTTLSSPPRVPQTTSSLCRNWTRSEWVPSRDTSVRHTRESLRWSKSFARWGWRIPLTICPPWKICPLLPPYLPCNHHQSIPCHLPGCSPLLRSIQILMRKMSIRHRLYFTTCSLWVVCVCVHACVRVYMYMCVHACLDVHAYTCLCILAC